MTGPADSLAEQLGWAAELTRRGPTPRATVLGSHLEGPFLSERRCGAQNEAYMIAPDVAVLERLIAAAEGTLRMTTVAPELDGALDLIRLLRREGHDAAMGHSDADYEQAKAAIRPAPMHATHLFNAMPPLHHREPGLVGAALGGRHSLRAHQRRPATSIRQWCELVFESSTPLLVTDAIDATGVGNGTYEPRRPGGQRSGQARRAWLAPDPWPAAR